MNTSVAGRFSTTMTTVRWDQPIKVAFDLMSQKSIRHLPVVGNWEQIVGVLSDRDCQRAMSRTNEFLMEEPKEFEFTFNDGDLVRDFMSWPVKTIDAHSTLKIACEKMIEEKISSLLVMENQIATGILTHEDLLKIFSKMLQDEEIGSAKTLKAWLYNSQVGNIAETFSNFGL